MKAQGTWVVGNSVFSKTGKIRDQLEEKQMTDWISVEEKLPEPYDEVLAFSESRGIHISGWTGERWMADCETTYWMQLPNPPEK